MDDDVGKLLVLTHDNMAEMYNIETIMSANKPGASLVSIEIPDGYQVVSGHEKVGNEIFFELRHKQARKDRGGPGSPLF